MKKIISILLSVSLFIAVLCTATVSVMAADNQATIKIKVSNKPALQKTREFTTDENKEDIAVILVIGQSNSTYGVGYKTELVDVENGTATSVSEVTATPQEGTVYSTLRNEPISELSEANDVVNLIETEKFGGYSAALGKTWYEKTGQKVVLVQSAVGGTCLHRWLPDQTGYTCSCGVTNDKLYANAVATFTETYNALKDDYNIVNTGYIWNQGENDEKKSASSGTTITTAEKYYEAYKSMHDSIMQDLPLDFGSIAVVRSDAMGNTPKDSMFFTIAREAQYKLCNDIDNLCMASRIFETCDGETDMQNTPAGSYGIHATQKTYNRVGVDAANNMLEFKHKDSEENKISTTALGTSPKMIKLALGCAEIDDSNTATKIVPRRDLKTSDFQSIWWIGDKTNGGYVAVQLKNALSTGGYSLQTGKNAKGQTSLEFTGHTSIQNQDDSSIEFYVFDPEPTTPDTGA